MWPSQDLNPGYLAPGPALIPGRTTTAWVETSSSHPRCGITNVQGPEALGQKPFALDREDGLSPRKPPTPQVPH